MYVRANQQQTEGEGQGGGGIGEGFLKHCCLANAYNFLFEDLGS